jgi:hypothetical protein
MSTKRRSFTITQRMAIYKAANGRCESCEIELGDIWHADHVIPFSLGGETQIENGQALCPTCNMAKGNRWSRRSKDSESLSPGGPIAEMAKAIRANRKRGPKPPAQSSGIQEPKPINQWPSNSPSPAPGGVAELAAAIRATRPAPVETPAPVYGRRAHGFVQLGVTVSPEARELLRAAAVAHDVSMSELLDAVLKRHMF